MKRYIKPCCSVFFISTQSHILEGSKFYNSTVDPSQTLGRWHNSLWDDEEEEEF